MINMAKDKADIGIGYKNVNVLERKVNVRW